MNSNRPHRERVTAHQRAGAAIDTFTVRLPRRLIVLRLAGRDALVRTTDRIEALVLVLAVVVSLLAIPIAAAVGTAVYDVRSRLYAEHAVTRHTVAATVTDAPAFQNVSRSGRTTVSARWTAAGAEHTGTVEAQSTAKAGDSVEVWVDANGAQVPPPTSTARAAGEAAMGALVIWISMTAIATSVFTVTRAISDRIRFTGWQRDLDNLVGNGGGYPHPGRTSDQ